MKNSACRGVAIVRRGCGRVKGRRRGAFLVSDEEAAEQDGACDDEVRGVVGQSVDIFVVLDGEPSLGYTARDGVDVFLDIPVLRHGYLDAAEDGVDVNAGGLLDYVGMPEVDGDAAEERGEAAAVEVS